MPFEGSAAEKVRGVGSTVEGAAPSTSTQCVVGSHSVATAPGMAEQRPELADGILVTAGVRSGGLMSCDPGVAVELLAFNAYVRRTGERMGHLSFSSRGGLERDGVDPLSRG